MHLTSLNRNGLKGENTLILLFCFRFIIWALLFIMVRLLTLTLSVLTFGFGLARAENPGFSIADGNFNILPVRYTKASRHSCMYNGAFQRIFSYSSLGE